MPLFDNPLRVVLQEVFASNEDLLEFLTDNPVAAASGILLDLPHVHEPRNQYLSKTVAQIEAHRLAVPALFDALLAKRPGQRDLITAAAQAYASTRNGTAAASVPADRKAMLRSLLPFDEGDTLPGRGAELQRLYTMVTSASFRFGAMWGNTGCGKTSLLCAGLLPLLRQQGHQVIHVPSPADLLGKLQSRDAAGITQALSRLPPRPNSCVLIAIDQFEELFLREPDRTAHERLAETLADRLGDGSGRVRMLVCIRADFFGKLHYLSPQLEAPTAPQHCYELDEFTRHAATLVLRDTVAEKETQFDDGLIDVVVKDLGSSDRVRPVELQIVATFLKARDARRRRDYDRLGGADGVMRAYVERELAASANKDMAILVLRQVCDFDHSTKSLRSVTLGEFERQLPGTLVSSNRNALLNRVIQRLEQARLIVRTADQSINLAHDYLAPLILRVTDDAETARGRAQRLLRRYEAEYAHDRAFRIPLRDLYWITRLAMAGDASRTIDKKLLLTSLSTALRRILMPPAVVLGVLAVAAYTTSWSYQYLDIKETALETERAGIVVRSGHPALSVLPYFDDIVVDTGFTLADMKGDKAADTVTQRVLSDYRWNRAAQYDDWAGALVSRLADPQRLRALRLLGETLNALEVAGPVLNLSAMSYSNSLGLAAATATTAQLAAVRDRLENICTRPAGRGGNQPSYPATCWAISGQLQQGHSPSLTLLGELGTAFGAYLEFARTIQPRVFRADPAEIGEGLRWLMTSAPNLATPPQADALLELVESGSSQAANLAVANVATLIRSNPDAAARLVPLLVQAFIALAPQEMPQPDSLEETLSRQNRRNLRWQLVLALQAVTETAPHLLGAAALEPLLAIQQRNADALIAYAVLASRPRTSPRADLAPLLAGCSRPGAAIDGRADACAAAMVLLDYSNLFTTEQLTTALDRALASTDLLVKSIAGHHALTHSGTYPAHSSGTARVNLLVESAAPSTGTPFALGTAYRYLKFHRELHAGATPLAESEVDALVNANASYLNRIQVRWLPLHIAGSHPRWLLANRKVLDDFADFSSTATNSWRPQRIRQPKPGEIALARARWQDSKSTSSLTLDDVFVMLRDRDDHGTRQDGICIAYFSWLEAGSGRDALEARLRELAKLSEPDIRMAANQALEMIWVGKLVLLDTAGYPSLGRARADLFAEHTDVFVQAAALLALEHGSEIPTTVAITSNRKTH